MKTFNEFIEHKKLEKVVYEAAELMVELDVDPAQYILSYVSKDPVVETALLEYIEINEAGMWDGIRNLGGGFVGRAIDAGKQFAGNVWGGKSGGGITGGWKQAADTLMGPKAKFDTAVRVLGDLVNSLMKNDVTKDMVADTPSGKMPIAKYIEDIVKSLNKQKEMIPVMTPKNDTQPQMRQPGLSGPTP